MFSIFLFCLSLPTVLLPSGSTVVANRLRLVAAPGQIGRVDDHHIDSSQLSLGDAVVLQLRVDNLDFTLAGAEIVVIYPIYRVFIPNDDAAFQGPHPPIRAHSDWGTVNLLELPIDQNGLRTAWMAARLGAVRFGAVVRFPSDRHLVAGGSYVLAEFEFLWGNYILGTPPVPCFSARSLFDAVTCDFFGTSCDFFADENGDRRNMNADREDLRVTLIHPTALLKGDINGDDQITTGDVSPHIQCAFFGQSYATCPLSQLPLADYLEYADINCSGTVNTADISPLVSLALGLERGIPYKNGPSLRFSPASSRLGFAAQGALAVAVLQFADPPPAPPQWVFADAKAGKGWRLEQDYQPASGLMTLVLGAPDQLDRALPDLLLTNPGDELSAVVRYRLLVHGDGAEADLPISIKNR